MTRRPPAPSGYVVGGAVLEVWAAVGIIVW